MSEQWGVSSVPAASVATTATVFSSTVLLINHEGIELVIKICSKGISLNVIVIEMEERRRFNFVN